MHQYKQGVTCNPIIPIEHVDFFTPDALLAYDWFSANKCLCQSSHISTRQVMLRFPTGAGRQTHASE